MRLNQNGNDYITSRVNQLLFRLNALDNGFTYYSVRFKTMHLEIQKCKKGRNETQILLLLDGSSQHLNCSVSIRFMN
jgi:hypothetical protein